MKFGTYLSRKSSPPKVRSKEKTRDRFVGRLAPLRFVRALFSAQQRLISSIVCCIFMFSGLIGNFYRPDPPQIWRMHYHASDPATCGGLKVQNFLIRTASCTSRAISCLWMLHRELKLRLLCEQMYSCLCGCISPAYNLTSTD